MNTIITTQLAFLSGGLGVPEMIIISVLGLLIFGKRLPEVARNLGKGIVEFKKGVKGIEDEVDRTSSRQEPIRNPAVDAAPETSAPAFEPPAQETASVSDEKSS